MKIVGQSGKKYLLDISYGLGQVLDLENGVLYPPMGLAALSTHVPWDDYTGPQEYLAEWLTKVTHLSRQTAATAPTTPANQRRSMDLLRASCLRGVLYGQAIGDALGLGTEFLSKAEVQAVYPSGLTDYNQIVQDAHRVRWQQGAWTDDTDQLLCILDSLLAQGRVDIQDIARRLLSWARNGGMGIGRTVAEVLMTPSFVTDPHAAAQAAWERSGRRAAANGAVMRTAVLGIWQYHDPAAVIANAEQVARITHADPRCIWSSVAVSVVISGFLRGELAPVAVQAAEALIPRYHDDRIAPYLARTNENDLAALDLDEGLNPGEPDRIGYTLKAVAAGWWALKHAKSFEDGMLAIVNEGGDADTNAAVAGALLGSRFGMTFIPQRWCDGLVQRTALEARIEPLIAAVEQLARP